MTKELTSWEITSRNLAWDIYEQLRDKGGLDTGNASVNIIHKVIDEKKGDILKSFSFEELNNEAINQRYEVIE